MEQYLDGGRRRADAGATRRATWSRSPATGLSRARGRAPQSSRAFARAPSAARSSRPRSTGSCGCSTSPTARGDAVRGSGQARAARRSWSRRTSSSASSRTGPSAEPYRVSDYELASRLSYFLWSSMPDDELFGPRRRRSGSTSPRCSRSRCGGCSQTRSPGRWPRDFAGQWLGVRDLLHRPRQPDPQALPRVHARAARRDVEEAVAFFDALFREDARSLELLDADYTYVNEALAKHYGIDGRRRAASCRRVELKDRNRGGVLGMAAVLTLTSLPAADQPGAARQVGAGGVLGTPPPPPPPNVPALPDGRRGQGRPDLPPAARAAPREARVRLAATAGWTRSASAWRTSTRSAAGATRSAGEPVDVVRRADHRREVRRPGGAEEASCWSSKEDFVRNLAEKMLAYALGRGLEYYDMPTVKQISERCRRRTATAARSLVLRDREELPVPVPDESRSATPPSGPGLIEAMKAVETDDARVDELSRRAVLRGAGVTIGLPLPRRRCSPLRCAVGAAGRSSQRPPPVRLAVLYMPNGVNPKRWTPDGAGARLRALADPRAAGRRQGRPAGPHRAEEPGSSIDGDGHYVKNAALLTGTTITKTTGSDLSSGGVSMDQLAAQRIGADAAAVARAGRSSR